MNDDDFKKVWREQVLPALSADDRKRLKDVLYSMAFIGYRIAKNEYREGDNETMQENFTTYKEIVSKIQTN
jgi:hypothetical protein